uniref:Uncharacterized protein n=1 Tax=Anguilla anguilla TaxID=7936 RepID=A0A0E9W056_ANGAN
MTPQCLLSVSDLVFK